MKGRGWPWRRACAPVLLVAVFAAAVPAQSGLRTLFGERTRAALPSLGFHDAIGVFVPVRPEPLLGRSAAPFIAPSVITLAPAARIALGTAAQPRHTMTLQRTAAGAPAAPATGTLMSTLVRMSGFRTLALTPAMSATLDVKRRSVGLKVTIHM